ncbi:hypothetical protein C0989_003243 [Termitomyces sp. Mn162]|nr:hypothetical protein C0989_003243 [Termitomyces sp. Mn162]
MSVETPFVIDNNDEANMPIEQMEPLPHMPGAIPQVGKDAPLGPRQSTQVPIPTTRANPANPPLSHTEQAIQESHKAGKRLQNIWLEKHQAAAVVQEPEAAHNDQDKPNPIDHDANVQPSGGVNAPAALPDLANVVTIEEIEHLLSVAESLGDPVSIDLGNEPHSWKEAQESPYAKEWEARY